MTLKKKSKSLSRSLFTKNLRSLMLAKDYSDAELAKQVGVSRVTIWRWRSGRQEPSGKDRDRLAKALRVTVSRLYEGK